MNQRRVARVERAMKMLEGRVEAANLGVVHHEPQSGIATFEFRRAF